MLVGLGLGIFILVRLLFILGLIGIAALLALVIRVIMDALGKRGFPPWLAVSTILAGIAAFGALAWFVLIPNVVAEIQTLIPQGPGSLQQKFQALVSRVQDLLGGLPFITDDFLSELPQRMQSYLTGLLGTVPGALPTFASVFSTALVGVIAVIFLAVYFAVSPGVYIAGIMRLVPGGRREAAREFMDVLREGSGVGSSAPSSSRSSSAWERG